jgi:hypothetical protein
MHRFIGLTLFLVRACQIAGMSNHYWQDVDTTEPVIKSFPGCRHTVQNPAPN